MNIEPSPFPARLPSHRPPLLTPGSRPYLLFLTALIAFGSVSTDLYLPSLPEVMRVFSTDVSNTQLTLSVFIATFAVAQLVYGPLSDAFGRRPLMLIGLAIYTAASLYCVIAPSIGGLIAGRFLQALGACVGPVMARAVVRDAYPVDRSAQIMAMMAMAVVVAPTLAPIVGGALQEMFGWRSSFVTMVGFGCVMLGSAGLLFRETNHNRRLTALVPALLLRTYRRLLSDRVFMGHSLTLSFSFGALFSFVSGSSFVLIGVLGVTPQVFGLCFAITVMGLLAGSFVSARFTPRFGAIRLIRTATILGLAASLALLALALAGVETLPAVLGPMLLSHFSGALLSPNTTAEAIAPHPRVAGTASALLGCMQMGVGAIGGWLVGLFDNGTSVPMAAFVAIFWVLAAVAHHGLVGRRFSRPAS